MCFLGAPSMGDRATGTNTTFKNARKGIIFGAGDSPGDVIADNIVIANNIKTATIVYRSSNPAIANVSASGLVTAIAPGSAAITVVQGTESNGWYKADVQVSFDSDTRVSKTELT